MPKGGVSEDEIWAELHAANIRRGGEWIETRLLASGPRTNPWFQECGPRIVQNNEIVAFDTDLIGAYGFCIDISRTWWVGDARPSNAMVSRLPPRAGPHPRPQGAAEARRHDRGTGACSGHQLDAGILGAEIQLQDARRRPVRRMALCALPRRLDPGAFDAALEPGMVLCVEALVSPEGGDFSIKLEDQVLITETGCENLTRYPFDPRLMG